jgi:hypothetical protein
MTPQVNRMPSTPYDRMLTLVHQEARSIMFESMITYEDALNYTLERLREELKEGNPVTISYENTSTYDCTSDDVNDVCHKDHY